MSKVNKVLIKLLAYLIVTIVFPPVLVITFFLVMTILTFVVVTLSLLAISYLMNKIASKIWVDNNFEE